MLPDRVSNPGPLTYESGALPIALRGPAGMVIANQQIIKSACTVAHEITVFTLLPKYMTVLVMSAMFFLKTDSNMCILRMNFRHQKPI